VPSNDSSPSSSANTASSTDQAASRRAHGKSAAEHGAGHGAGHAAQHAAERAAEGALAIYLHIPFCVVKCGYCDFHSLAGSSEEEMSAVLDAMLRELDCKLSKLKENYLPYTVFLGGGTPTHVPDDLLHRFLEGLNERLDLTGFVERSCEANPESLDRSKLQILEEQGIQRLSLGVQSFDAEQLRFLDRPHDPECAAKAVRAASESGAFDVSLDMIYGLPGQTLEDWQRELDRGLALGTDHVSAYHLTFEAGTALHARRERGEIHENPDELQRGFFDWTHQRMSEQGRPAYEVSNFARPGYECLHNLHYWHAGDYLGIGPSASEHIQGRRSRNWKSTRRYLDEIQKTGRADAEQEQLSAEERLREAIWLGLRTRMGIELASLQDRFHCQLELNLSPIIERCLTLQWLEEVDGRLRIPAENLAFADGIAQQFL
jgi:oxygen-independent coproporphyrinogen-3 oxidase